MIDKRFAPHHDEIARRLQAGESPYQISKMYPRSTVYRTYHQLIKVSEDGIMPRKYSPLQKKEARDALVNGLGAWEVSELTGIPRRTINKWMQAIRMCDESAKAPPEQPKPIVGDLLKNLNVPDVPAPDEPIQVKSQQVKVSLGFTDLELFIIGLKSLIADYERLKAEKESFRKLMEKWKSVAGKLNDDIQRLAAPK